MSPVFLYTVHHRLKPVPVERAYTLTHLVIVLSYPKVRVRLQFFSDFLLLTDVNELINNECFHYVIPHLNISSQFTRSHPAKEKIPVEIPARIARLTRPTKRVRKWEGES